MIQHETVGMPRSPALSDLPLVSREVKATFDVVGRATGKAMRITMHATVGIPYDEDGLVEDAGSFQVDDFDGRSRLDYLRLDGGLYALRHGLARWQKPFVGLARELDVLDGFTEDTRLMPYAPATASPAPRSIRGPRPRPGASATPTSTRSTTCRLCPHGWPSFAKRSRATLC